MAYQELKGGETRLWYDPETEEIAIGPGTDSTTDPLNGRRVISDTGQTYALTLAQSGTDAPVPTEFKPLSGFTAVLARSSEGVYTLTSTNDGAEGPFTDGKTFVRQCEVVAMSGTSGTSMKASCVITSTSVLTITVRDAGGTPVDVFGTLYLEIVIYS